MEKIIELFKCWLKEMEEGTQASDEMDGVKK